MIEYRSIALFREKGGKFDRIYTQVNLYKSIYSHCVLMKYNKIMPTILRIKGFRFFFFSNEANEPVHIHVESDDKYAKFWLEPVQLAKSAGYSARELVEIRKFVVENAGVFERRWDEYFGH